MGNCQCCACVQRTIRQHGCVTNLKRWTLGELKDKGLISLTIERRLRSLEGWDAKPSGGSNCKKPQEPMLSGVGLMNYSGTPNLKRSLNQSLIYELKRYTKSLSKRATMVHE